MLQILVVEDEKNIKDMMCEYLQNNGFATLEASHGVEALNVMKNSDVDLIITDIMMPIMNGLVFAEKVRELNCNVPILMITAKETIDDKEDGYNSGADDYMVKPIILKEMLLRINALIKRSKIETDKKLVVKNTVLNLDTFEVSANGESITMTKKEFLLLFKLLSEPNRIFTKNQLMDDIWGYDSESFDNTVKVHISKIRDKFKNTDDFELVAVRGLGYKAVVK
ncbi:MAG: response regulator transcription factor [Clostridia bacterium]